MEFTLFQRLQTQRQNTHLYVRWKRDLMGNTQAPSLTQKPARTINYRPGRIAKKTTVDFWNAILFSEFETNRIYFRVGSFAHRERIWSAWTPYATNNSEKQRGHNRDTRNTCGPWSTFPETYRARESLAIFVRLQILLICTLEPCSCIHSWFVRMQS